MVQKLTVKEMEDLVRSGQLVAEHNKNNARKYKGVFFGKNFHLYRYVNKGIGYRGKNYPEPGWALAYSETEEFSDNSAPTFVSIKEYIDSCKNCEYGFPTGLDDKPRKGYVWCSTTQTWMIEDCWCALYKYDRELPSRGD